MSTSSLQRYNRPARRRFRASLEGVLTALLVGALLLAALLLLRHTGMTGLSSGRLPELMGLWGVAALIGWLLSRQGPLHSPVHPQRHLLFAPVWAFLVASALFLAVGQLALVPLLLALHLLWLIGLLLAQRAAQHTRPPLQVGVPTGAGSSLKLFQDTRTLRGAAVQFVHPQQHDLRTFTRLDLLLAEPEWLASPEYRRLLEHAQVTKVPVWPRSRLYEELTGKVALDAVNLEWLSSSDFRSGYEPVKRVLDVLATVLALPLLLPLMLLVALVVLMNSGAPVLFRQERVGRGGRTFRIVKFRTMTRDSERSGPAFAAHGDLRVTPVGAFLRKFRLDELPQFWNVLRGEMSIIGPRPEQWAFAADFEESIPLYASRHWVRPGITGWAQVNQGYTDSHGQTAEKLQYDFYYVKHLSGTLDLLVVGKTIRTILSGFGSR